MSMLHRIIEALKNQHRQVAMPYLVPGLWVDAKTLTKQAVNPYEFYAQRIQQILNTEPEPLVDGNNGDGWSRQAIVYNLFPRVAAAFDHAGDGRLRLKPRPDGWRDTGTLLKAITLLPYIKRLGCNTVHLLPITAVGQDGKKGTLGSPYAIRNPYRLDDMLAEPALGFSTEELFLAFVEAAHHLGLRVVMEFVLRTGSRDSDWIKEHPNWFYWIRADIPDRAPGSRDPFHYGLPIFDGDTLGLLKWKVEQGDFHDLPAPPDVYRNMFTPPPRPEQVFMKDGRWFATLDDGTWVRVPGAFTDWPPDDIQPPWTDVTYLRMYDHPDFNYSAYNTLRMYDTRLAAPENANMSLWDAVAGVIPYYQKEFAIDGVMLDMGHALPMALKGRMVEEAHRINPNFVFWEENFAIDSASRQEGYDAVMGYLLFALNDPNGLHHFINRWAGEHVPIPFFATPENHNTPRAASRTGNGRIYSYYTLPLCIAMPGIPFIHNGFELAEQQPINTGLGFTNEMLAQYPADLLPLFSEYAFDWTREDNLIDGVRYALGLRQGYADLLSNDAPDSWCVGMSNNPHILVFTRTKGDLSLSFIANTDQRHHQSGRVLLSGQWHRTQGVWGTEDIIQVHNGLALSVDLSPGYVLVLEGDELPINCL
ncbi:MAG: alpha-amylase [Anaerolineae bacterium]|nr:alpha-amylase [Anaerolineae bacterium]